MREHCYTLDGTRILRETYGTNVLVTLHNNEDGLCGIIYNGEPYYFVKNLQGDIIALVDEDCNTVVRYTYDGCGKSFAQRQRGLFSVYMLDSKYFCSDFASYLINEYKEKSGKNSKISSSHLAI